MSNIHEVMTEREILISAFDQVTRAFEARQWIVDGRGPYAFNDDQYREEVRYLFDDFDQIKDRMWSNIKSKTHEYKAEIERSVCVKFLYWYITHYDGPVAMRGATINDIYEQFLTTPVYPGKRNNTIMNDYIINQFVGTDTGRKSLLIPGEIDGYTYATDANSVIRIKSELLAFKYITPDKFPKADSVYKNFEGNPLEVDIQEISQQIAQFRYSLLGRTCEKCCGEGTITCGHCDSEYTCKECSGDGRSASGHVFKKTWFYDKADDHARMKVGNRWYSPLQIERVMIVAKFCGLDKFLILNDNKDREGARIDIGPFELVVIPLLID